MSSWIKCRPVAIDGTAIFVNLDNITSISPSDHGSTLLCAVGGGSSIEVRETPEDLMKLAAQSRLSVPY